MPTAGQPIERPEFDAARLFVEHPPVWHHRNKQVVAQIASPPGCSHHGTIRYSRWSAFPLPVKGVSAATVSGLPPGLEDRRDLLEFDRQDFLEPARCEH